MHIWKIQIFCDMTWSHWASTCQSFEGSQYHCIQYRSFQCSATARFWKWRNYDPLQRWRQSAQWHSIISQKTWTISTSAVRITDLTFYGSPLNLPPVTQQTTLHYNNVMLRSNLYINGFLTLPQSCLIIKSDQRVHIIFFFLWNWRRVSPTRSTCYMRCTKRVEEFLKALTVASRWWFRPTRFVCSGCVSPNRNYSEWDNM